VSIPKQPQNIDPKRRALAPYNFVELPERIAKVDQQQLPPQNRFDPQRHSGWLDCRLTTAAPAYVRAALTLEQARAQLKSKDLDAFFYVEREDQPVIPGSSLRGLFRALIEIISYSKVSEVAATRLIYRAVGDTTSHGKRYRDRVMQVDEREKLCDPKMMGGYLRQIGSDWYIRPAQEIHGASFAVLREPERSTSYFDNLKKNLAQVDGCRNAYKIYVKTKDYEYYVTRGGYSVGKVVAYEPSPAPKNGWVEATLALSGPMASKRSEAVIFAEDPTAELLKLSDDQVAAYREQVSKEQEKLVGKGGALRDGQPVFYTLNPPGEANSDEPVEFFGHCRMLRLPYRRSPRDLVPEELRRETDLDLTEAIFGFTKQTDANFGFDKQADGKRLSNAYAGRVFFGDARLVPGQTDIWLLAHRAITPHVLGTPKPTTFQHYLVQTQPNKFEIGRDKRGQPKYETRLADYTEPQAVIRGHKLYWHKGEVKLGDIESQGKAKDAVLTRIRPLRAGVEFSFRIRFDNLSDVELGALLWTLQVAGDDRYRLKLGMGKPLGLGALKIESELRLLDRAARYATLFSNDDWAEAVKDGSATGDIRQRAIPAFERFVLSQIKEPSARRLAELERIKQLLTMLSWPGPDKEQTRYLEIERNDPQAPRGKRNEYKKPEDRPVLPSPLSVWQIGVSTSLTQQMAAPAVEAEAESAEKILTGEVKVFGLGANKSYGFIKPYGGGPDVFVRLDALPPGQTTLVKGRRVRYVLHEDGEEKTRPKAKRVLPDR
jgi:CRISPR-associated protein (TIGR03986 family)